MMQMEKLNYSRKQNEAAICAHRIKRKRYTLESWADPDEDSGSGTLHPIEKAKHRCFVIMNKL